jgi:NAD(P)-dependent dehydrogenase (short-subunit alcohol dehydrogenase family)
MIQEPGRFSEEVVLVTGAGAGFGRTIALAYGSVGATVVAADYSVELVTEVASEIEDQGGIALPLRADMAQAGDVYEAFAKVQELFKGNLRGIVHTSRQLASSAFLELGEAEWMNSVHQHLSSAVFVLQHAVRSLPGEGFATLVLPPSSDHDPHHLALRGALTGLIQGVSVGFPQAVRCNGVLPNRPASKDPDDQGLAEVVLALGAAAEWGGRGETLRVELPEAPLPADLYNIFAL